MGFENTVCIDFFIFPRSSILRAFSIAAYPVCNLLYKTRRKNTSAHRVKQRHLRICDEYQNTMCCLRYSLSTVKGKVLDGMSGFHFT